jgi:secreted trypsin-like serine protease
MPGVDIALLTLASPLPVALASAILPVEKLAEPADPAIALYAVGFGEADARWAPGVKHHTRLKFTTRLCTASSPGGCQLDLESIAVSYHEGRRADSCYADSGGPLFIEQNKRMKLIGIVSRGLVRRADGYCGDGGIYSSLEASAIRRWLDQQLSGTR